MYINTHRYIITFSDYFTKWVEAATLPTKEAKGVGNFLYSLFCRHGIPKRIQSNQGKEFVNSLTNHLFKLTGVHHIISTAHHPQTNRLDERFNQTLQRALLKMMDENQNEWDKFLDSVLFAYRTSKQASTKFSHFFLLYGREPTLPVDLIVSNKVKYTILIVFYTCTCVLMLLINFFRMSKGMKMKVIFPRSMPRRSQCPCGKVYWTTTAIGCRS